MAAIGSLAEVAGFALAGVTVHPIDSPGEATAAWESLAPDTAVVILGQQAAVALETDIAGEHAPLTVVLPP